MKKTLLGTWLLAVFLAYPAVAQTHRVVQDHQLWAVLQTELALKNGDYLLLLVHGENVPAYNQFTNINRLSVFDSRGVAATYEHFWSDHWSGGALLGHTSYSGFKYVAPELLLRHRSPVGPLTFGQRLGLSRTIGVGNLGRVVGREGSNFAALRVDLEKLFPVGKGSVMLRPRLSYEAATHVRLQKNKNDADERIIQHTNLRGEVGCRLGNFFDFTPWFAYATSYYFTIPQYDSMGNPTGGGRYNQVTPVIGLDVRFTLFQGKTAFERRQLPTQH